MFLLQIKEFLNHVCEQIQYKPVQNDIAEELKSHVEDLKKEFMLEGMEEKEAEKKAVEQMGNAEEIGKKLNQIHRPKLDWKLLLITCVLLVFGALVVLIRKGEYSTSNYGLTLILGVVFSAVIYFLDYRKIFKVSNYLYGIATLIMILVLKFGVSVNGAAMYFSTFGKMIFVPMLAIPLYILAFIGFIEGIDKTKNWKISFSPNSTIDINRDILKIIGLSAISLGFFAMIPRASLMFMLGIVYLIIATVKLAEQKENRKVYIGILWGIPILLGLLFILFELPTIWERLTLAFMPEKDAEGGGWLGVNQKVILESAALVGEAEDMSYALSLFDEGTNFAFISILAHYGWLVSLAMLATIVAFSIKLIINATKIKETYGRLIVVGISSLFILQCVFNLLMNLNLGIKSDINMPFVSYGNTNLMVDMIGLAFILSVYRRKDIMKEERKIAEN